MRKIQFQTDQYYHIYNRGVDKRNIFLDNKDYIRFLTGMKEFNRTESIGSLRDLTEAKLLEASRSLASVSPSPLVKIIAYCINPNHYHLLLKQIVDRGIEKFLHKIGTGYTKYFNTKHNRSGSLFQGPFQAIHITTNNYLLQLSCYINGNSEIHKIAKAENYPWSSYQDYLGKKGGKLCAKETILKQFEDVNEYKNLTEDIIKDSFERKEEIRGYLLE